MKNDIVYFVKDTAANEELRYSLRSVCENFSFRNSGICGIFNFQYFYAVIYR